MEVYKVDNPKEGFWIINELSEVTIFLIEGKNRALLIDSGFGLGPLDQIVQKLTSMPITVINTHAHPDHVMGNFLFSDILISKEDKEALEYFNTKKARELFSFVHKKHMIDELYTSEWLNKEPKDVAFIEDGYVIELGELELEIVSIPGHSAGSIAILNKQDRSIFTGDTIMKEPIMLHYPDSLYLHTYLQSLVKLKNYGSHYDSIYSSHGEYLIEKKHIEKLIECTEAIISGDLSGEIENTQFGNAIRYTLNGVSILSKQS